MSRSLDDFAGLDLINNVFRQKPDFRFLNVPYSLLNNDKFKNLSKPLPILNEMVKNGRVGCLTHPVCQAYLNIKW